MAEVIIQLNLNDESRLSIIESEHPGELTRFVIDRFSERITENGIELFSDDDSLHSKFKLYVTVTKALVRYEKMQRKGFLGEGFIERHAEVGLSLRVVNNNTKKVDWIREIDEGFTDQIPASMLDQVEEGGLLLGKPKRPNDRGVMRWIEPILVAGAVGSAAYLFYIVRSR